MKERRDWLADLVMRRANWCCFLREEWLWVRKLNGGGSVTPLVDKTGHIYGLTAGKRKSMACIVWEDEREAA